MYVLYQCIKLCVNFLCILYAMHTYACTTDNKNQCSLAVHSCTIAGTISRREGDSWKEGEVDHARSDGGGGVN